MPRSDRQFFEDMSGETRFQVDVLEKVYRLMELLKEIVKTDFAEKLVLKGGTAINFIYFDLPRLSVDIDMDYIGSLNKKIMMEERDNIDGVLNKIFGYLDYEVEKDYSYALTKYNLYYKNSAENRDRIKLEINYLKRTTMMSTCRGLFKQPFGRILC